jgi:membrane associated rhomboid family serine protease
MAGVMRFMFGAQPTPGRRMPDFVRAPRMSLGQTLSDKRLLAVLLLWIALNAYFGLSGFGLAGEEGSIAWEAHIGGFLCGLLIFGAFDKVRREDEAPLRL